MKKLDLYLNAPVEIVKTGSGLDMATGRNLGKATEGIVDFYIILLDEPLPDRLAVVMSESCLILMS